MTFECSFAISENNLEKSGLKNGILRSLDLEKKIDFAICENVLRSWDLEEIDFRKVWRVLRSWDLEKLLALVSKMTEIW